MRTKKVRPKQHRTFILKTIAGVRTAIVAEELNIEPGKVPHCPLKSLHNRLDRDLHKRKRRDTKNLANLFVLLANNKPLNHTLSVVAYAQAYKTGRVLLDFLDTAILRTNSGRNSRSNSQKGITLYSEADLYIFGSLMSRYAIESTVAYAARYEEHLVKHQSTLAKVRRGKREFLKERRLKKALSWKSIRLQYEAFLKEESSKKRPLSKIDIQKRVADKNEVSVRTVQRAIRGNGSRGLAAQDPWSPNSKKPA